MVGDLCPLQYEDGYVKWYLTISHPRIIPLVKHTDDIGPSDVGVPIDGVSSLSPSSADCNYYG